MAHIDKKIGYLPGETAGNNVINYLEWHGVEFPERIALKWVDSISSPDLGNNTDFPFAYKQISYGEFSNLTGKTAKNLQLLGIKKGDRVILFLPMSLELYTAMFAVQRIGAIAVFLDSWARRDQLSVCAACAEPVAMISHQMAFELTEGVEEFQKIKFKIIAGPGHTINYSASLKELMTRDNGISKIEPVSSETTALITFTTGSSGKPKGANRTHCFLSAQHNELNELIPYTAEDKDLPAFPIFSLNNIASGVTTVLPALNLANPTSADSAILANQIINEKLTCCTLSPSMVSNLSAYCNEKNIKLAGLTRVVTGGAPISKDDVINFCAIAPQAKVWILYGSTEVEPMAHIEAQEMIRFPVNDDPDIIDEGVNVGHVSDNLNYKFIRVEKGIIDGEETSLHSLEVPSGEVGEFIVTGDHVCRDYYNNAEAFERAKIKDKDGRVWHRTGDLAYLDEKKYLWIVGRIHNVIKRNEKYYFPVRPEILLKRFDFVEKCAFLGLPDDVLGESCVAIIVPNTGYKEVESLEKIKTVFNKNHIPIDKIYCVNSIPLDPRHHSKVEYDKLKIQIQNEKAVYSTSTPFHIN